MKMFVTNFEVSVTNNIKAKKSGQGFNLMSLPSGCHYSGALSRVCIVCIKTFFINRPTIFPAVFPMMTV